MRSRVNATVGCPSVRLPACSIVRQPLRPAAGLLLSAAQTGYVDRQLQSPAAAELRTTANDTAVSRCHGFLNDDSRVDEAEHRFVY